VLVTRSFESIFFGKGLTKSKRSTGGRRFAAVQDDDDRLASSDWLVGGKISAMDIGVFPLVQLLLRAASKSARPFSLGFLRLREPSQRRQMGAGH
jgi:hypothetical protein